MKFGVVNKSTILNRFVLHTLERNITPLAVITRKTNIILGILKGGELEKSRLGGGGVALRRTPTRPLGIWRPVDLYTILRNPFLVDGPQIFSKGAFGSVIGSFHLPPHPKFEIVFFFSVVLCVIMAECLMLRSKVCKTNVFTIVSLVVCSSCKISLHYDNAKFIFLIWNWNVGGRWKSKSWTLRSMIMILDKTSGKQEQINFCHKERLFGKRKPWTRLESKMYTNKFFEF